MRQVNVFQFIIVSLLFLISFLTIEFKSPSPVYRGFGIYPVPEAKKAITGFTFHHETENPFFNPFLLPVSIVDDLSAVPDEIPILDEGFYISEAFDYQLGNARLAGLQGSLQKETTLTINGLDSGHIARLNTGMINVTGEYDAYRMLPHGTSFNRDITVILPYDTALLPPGFSSYDIMTYYYNEEYQRWMPITRDSVDVVNSLVISRVNHFTDFINAVMQMPEMPETQAYVPTAMSDIQIAEPLTGFSLMSPPTGNSRGSADIIYPIEIPAGRQGIQPQLNLTYNSNKGSGWMGIGWDITIPAITLDTRWGVPRFDSNMESEIYLLNGEQLATKNNTGEYNPLIHRGDWMPRQEGDVRFYPRTEGNFHQIIRHGDSPRDYWWEVRDKNGIIYFYGKHPEKNSVDPAAVLCDVHGNIAKWGLTEIRDLHENFVLYKYETVQRHLGKAMYLQEIAYTGYKNTEGKYKVSFERSQRETFGFPDITTNGRYGFMEVDDDLLTYVHIYYDNALIKGYEFRYFCPNRKTLLRGFRELPADQLPYPLVEEGNPDRSTPTLTHNFNYYNNGISFGEEININTGDEDLKVFMKEKNIPFASSIGGSASESKTQGERSVEGRRKKNINKNSNISSTTTTDLLTFLDIDGDGLPDKVFRNNGKIYYRKQYLIDNISYFREPVLITGINHFAQSKSENISMGSGFSNKYGWFKNKESGVSHNYNYGITSVNTFFSDVDGDGIPDIVSNGKIYYNRAKDNGDRYFVPEEQDQFDSQDNCNYPVVANDVPVDESVFAEGKMVIVERTEMHGAENLLSNGDFELGNTAFSSVFSYRIPPLSNLANNQYTVTSSGQIQNISGTLYDHTYSNTDGKFLAVGGLSGSQKIVWKSQTIPVTPNTEYDLSLWYNIFKYQNATSFLSIRINNIDVGQVYWNGDKQNMNIWKNHKLAWHSGSARTASITITCTADVGFLLDDLFFSARISPEEYVVYDTIITPKRTIPQYDAVKVWIAPYSGDITIDLYGGLTADLNELRLNTPVMDGVNLIVQLNGDILSKVMLMPLKQPDIHLPKPIRTYIEKGDRVYFWMESAETSLYDKMEWQQLIYYTDILINGKYEEVEDFSDADDKSVYFYNYHKDFLLNGQQKSYMPEDGMIRIESKYILNYPLSDNVEFCFFHNGSKTVLNPSSQIEISVNENDSIWFCGLSSTNVNWSRILWDICYYYISFADPDIPNKMKNPITGDNEPTIGVNHILPYFTTFPKPVFPTYVYRNNKAKSLGRVDVRVPGAKDLDKITMSVKNRYSFCKKQTGYIQNGRVILDQMDCILEANKEYFFDLYLSNTNSTDNITDAYFISGNEIFPVGLHGQHDPEMEKFGPMYRNWGQFAYRKDSLDGLRIKESRLRLPDAGQWSDIIQNYENLDTNNIENLFAQVMDMDIQNTLYRNFMPMLPDYARQRWVADCQTYVDAYNMANSSDDRVGEVKNPYTVKNRNGELGAAIKKQIYTVNSSVTFSNKKGKKKPYYGKNMSHTHAYVISDFIDMNGDLYPDALGEYQTLYSKPQGGLSDLKKGHSGIRNSTYIGRNDTKSFNSDGNETERTEINGQDWKITMKNSLGICDYSGATADITESFLVDINGDGLPDRIYKDGKVSFNLGYKHTLGTMEKLSYGINENTVSEGFTITEEDREEMDMSYYTYHRLDTALEWNWIRDDALAYKSFITFMSSGISSNISFNESFVIFRDMNNDKLVDKLFFELNGIYISYNLGTKFSNRIKLIDKSFYNSANVELTSYKEKGSAGSSGFTDKSRFSVDGKGWGVTRKFFDIMDLNGDGYPDLLVSDEHGNIKVRYNQGGKDNLLKNISISIGEETDALLSQTTLDYTFMESSQECSRRFWTMTSVIKEDDENSTKIIFEYEDPYYDRYEREFYGFGTVKTIQPYNHENVYRVITEKYHNRDYMRKYRKYYELLSSDLTGNRKYTEKFYHYKLKNINTGHDISGQEHFCYGTGYPALDEEIIYHYEGVSSPQITTRKKYEYGQYGNIKTYYNYGDTQASDDDFRVEITYHTDRNNLNLIGIPVLVQVKPVSGNAVLRKKENTVDPHTGKFTRVISGDAVYNFTYDDYGNISRVSAPGGMKYSYTYDPEIYTYPIQVQNNLDYVSRAEYDYRWGKPLSTTDINNNSTLYWYDHRGRIIKIRGPYEHDYTMKFYYSVDDRRWTWDLSGNVAKAKTLHYDPANPGNPMTTISFSNGFTMNQVKKDTEVAGLEVMNVSGREIRDFLLRVSRQYDPDIENIGTQNYKYRTNNGSLPYSVITYDFLDRQTSITLPDGSVTRMAYGTGSPFGRKQFSTVITDARGNSTTRYTDVRGLETSVHEPGDIITRFIYNVMGELEMTIDPEKNETRYEYDQMGRLAYREHPDAGIDQYEYDAAGNLIRHFTSTLQQDNSEPIKYHYEYNQLKYIEYPENPYNNVFYEYGASGEPGNATGRVVFMSDASGFQEFSYGALGEITKNKRTFVLPYDNEYTIEMQYRYDTWNRIREIIYPDGEIVDYQYDRGGSLKSVSSLSGSSRNAYIRDIRYDKFGQKIYMEYGNGDITRYTYDNLQRLATMRSVSGKGEVMQDMIYTYDRVSNITEILNTAKPVYGLFGGEYALSYAYDDVNRMKYGSGEWFTEGTNGQYGGNHAETPGDPNQYTRYTTSMDYDRSGKILMKSQYVERYGLPVKELTYDRHYSYNPPGRQPNTLLETGDCQYEWDANGNMLRQFNRYDGSERELCWDEENRLKSVKDRQDKSSSFYLYDADGERFYKKADYSQLMNINGKWHNIDVSSVTLYASPFLVATPEGYTKHYYAGSERLASRIGHLPCATLESIENRLEWYGIEKVRPENWEHKCPENWENITKLNILAEGYGNGEECYYYHTDHLGSSSWVTDQDAEPVHYMAYMPFGEALINHRYEGDNRLTRYTFSGKERDQETGYSYFGARYYDSGLSIWLSVDPMAELYASMSPFVYCGNNPVNMIDFDGRAYDPLYYCGMLGEVTVSAPYFTGPPPMPDIPYAVDYSITPLSGFVSWLQIGLDVVGLVPGIGEIADGINSLIYACQGDYVNAGLSAGAMIPFVGWAATGTKLGVKAAKGGKKTIKSVGAAARSWTNVKMMNESILKKQGLDPHKIKTEFLGPKNISKYDLYKHTDTGEILIFRKGGHGEPIFTGYFIE